MWLHGHMQTQPPATRSLTCQPAAMTRQHPHGPLALAAAESISKPPPEALRGLPNTSKPPHGLLNTSGAIYMRPRPLTSSARAPLACRRPPRRSRPGVGASEGAGEGAAWVRRACGCACAAHPRVLSPILAQLSRSRILMSELPASLTMPSVPSIPMRVPDWPASSPLRMISLSFLAGGTT